MPSLSGLGVLAGETVALARTSTIVVNAAGTLQIAGAIGLAESITALVDGFFYSEGDFDFSQHDEFTNRRLDALEKAGKAKDFYIGRHQGKVAEIARERNGVNVWDLWNRLEDVDNYDHAIDGARSIEYNLYLIRKLVERGFRFLDVSPGVTSSEWLNAERELLKALGQIIWRLK